MYLIKKGDIKKIAKALEEKYALHGPYYEEASGQCFFGKVSAAALAIDAPIPTNPPKHVVFPHLETIMTYKYDKKAKKADIEMVFDEVPKALFGMRSCDLVGLQCIDRFFLGQEFVDDTYRYHRSRMFIIANTCTVPFKQCFCVCTDSGPSAFEGFDLNLTALGDGYLVEVGSEKGKAFIEAFGFPPAGDEHLKEKQNIVNTSIAMFDTIAVESKAWVSRVTNRATTGFIKEEIWEYIGNQCIECGACSFVCPTCTCFNISDANTLQGNTERLRTWDSCSYEGYSRMAGGHNPRHPVEDRRNKRFFCKLSYSQSKKYLRPGCVGCGRCGWVCPGDIGLPNVVTYIRREIHE